VTPRLAWFFVLLTTSLVLYVYRFFIAGVNLSVFRLIVVGWSMYFGVDLWRGRLHVDRRWVPLATIVGAIVIVNAIDFLTLSGYPALRRDIANHVFNLWFAMLIVVYVDSGPKVRSLVQAFTLSSLVTTAIGVYSFIFDHLPFEGLMRVVASDMSRSLTYINDDTVFRRATSSFFDPNFYGIYSMLAVICCIWLWRYDKPRWWVGALFATNLVCLTLTLSRTAVVGLFVALALLFLQDARARKFVVATAGATLVLLYLSTFAESHALWRYVSDEWSAMIARSADTATAPSQAGQPGLSAPATSSSAVIQAQERASDVRSVELRMAFIERGIRVFEASPVWGRGSASLLTTTNQWSSAHVTYLTMLARYGVLGTAVYLAFLLYPAVAVWAGGAPAAQRVLVLCSLGSLLVVYLSYDVFFFFEIQYVFFGLAWAIVVHRFDWTSHR
jgi:O-antigen ligase